MEQPKIGVFLSDCGKQLSEILDFDALTSFVKTVPNVALIARGTLIHHYQLDENALAKKVNLVVATTHNAPGICMSMKNAAQGLIQNGEVNDGILNKVEMAFRAYDPCFACATHFAIGEMPLEVNVFDNNKQLLKTIRR